jgi:phage tail tape measure protein, TP901 family|nr:MAG TPA: minor tail protein [Caudoviricetes sp.]
MAQEATLTFNMELKGLNNILKAVDRSTISLGDKLNANIKAGIEKYNAALQKLKVEPFQKAGFHTQMAKLKEDLQRATKAKIRIDMDEAKQKLANLKTEIVASVASVAAIAAPIKSAIDFESSMADVKKVVDFKTPDELKEFSNQILNMSRDIPLSVNEIASITASGGQLGIAKENLMDFTQTAAKMGVAFDMSAKEAGDNMATLMNIFNMSVDGVRGLGDTINHLSNNSASTANKIVNAVGRIAGNAKDMGLSADATAGLASSFIALGKQPEVAATAINSMLTVLNNADKAGGDLEKAFKSIGLSGKELKAQILKNPQKALTDFLHTLSKVPKEKKTGVLTTIFGKNFGDDISLLTGAIENFDKAMALSGDNKRFGSMEAEFQSRSDTTENKIQLMKNALNELSVSFGRVFLPYIKRGVEKITEFIQKITEFVRSNEDLVKKIGFSVAAFFGFNVAMTTLKASSAILTLSLGGYRQILMMLPFDCLKLNASLSQCNILMKTKAMLSGLVNNNLKSFRLASSAASGASLGFVGGLKKIVLGFRALSLAFLSNPIGLVLAAIATAGALIYKYWDHVKAFLLGTFEALSQNCGWLTDALSGVWNNAIKPIFSGIASLFELLFNQSNATSEELGAATNAGREFGKWMSYALNIITFPLQAVCNIINAIALIIDIVRLKFSTWIEEAKSLLNDLLAFFQPVVDAFNSIVDGFKNLDISGGLKDMLGAKDGADRSWYNPLNLFYDSKPKTQSTSGAISENAEAKRQNAANNKNQTINDNKVVNITMSGSSATPQAVAKAVQNSSYSYGD